MRGVLGGTVSQGCTLGCYATPFQGGDDFAHTPGIKHGSAKQTQKNGGRHRPPFREQIRESQLRRRRNRKRPAPITAISAKVEGSGMAVWVTEKDWYSNSAGAFLSDEVAPL